MVNKKSKVRKTRKRGFRKSRKQQKQKRQVMKGGSPFNLRDFVWNDLLDGKLENLYNEKLIDAGVVGLCNNPSPWAVDILYQLIYDNGVEWFVNEVESWDELLSNPNITRLLEIQQFIPLLKNGRMVEWGYLSSNPHTESFLQQYPDIIDYDYLSANPNPGTVEFLKKNPNEINYEYLSKNPNPEAIKLLLETPSEIDWDNLVLNLEAWETNEKNFNLLNLVSMLKNKIKTDKSCLSSVSKIPNLEIIEFLKKNPKFIDWEYFSQNTHEMAIKYLEENPEKIQWDFLSMNPSAIHMLKENLDKIDWYFITKNPNAFEIFDSNKEIVKQKLLQWRGDRKIYGEGLFSNPSIFEPEFVVK